MAISGEETITLQLTKSQALVLFEWLVTHTGDDAIHELHVNDSAERDVLWGLEGKLEKALPDVFAPDYSERLNAARTAIRGQPN